LSQQAEQTTEGRTIGWARWYDISVEAVYFGKGNRYRSRMLDLAEVKAGDRVLDVGCGPGRLVLAACERVGKTGEAHGIDPSEQMVALATRKAARAGLSARFSQAAAEKLPFEDGYFDVVTSSLVIHHIPGDDLRLRAFGEMRRVLKGGGRLLVVDFQVPESGPLRPFAKLLGSHMHAATIDDYPELMESAGLTPVDRGEAAFKVFRYVLGRRSQMEDSR
jgi:demethylmenaquinone methyltransferase/2-methoxy-6-polyprenyl-1,4-benzoquinol methylase/phosphoethanolamine N-methyltransferase